jgi:hypothetical protein
VVSIHAPTRGATQHTKYAGPRALVSIHAPTRGATKRALLQRPPPGFQFTRPRGARPNGYCWKEPDGEDISNSTIKKEIYDWIMNKDEVADGGWLLA